MTGSARLHVGIGGPVGSGKTALTLALCRALREKYSLGVVTNDIFTREDYEFLTRNEALPAGPHPCGGDRWLSSRCRPRGRDVEPRGAREPHHHGHGPTAADPALRVGRRQPRANFSNELADYTVYVIDVAGGDKVPRKGGPGVTQADLLVINKIDLAEAVGADLDVMERDAERMHDEE